VIYGGADPRRFHPDGADRRAGVLFVGRLTPHKGVDRLIRALPAGAELTCVGTGGHDLQAPESGYGQLLRRLASGRLVTFTGEVPDHQLPELYRRAQVVVLPSVHRTCYGRQVAISELLGSGACLRWSRTAPPGFSSPPATLRSCTTGSPRCSPINGSQPGWAAAPANWCSTASPGKRARRAA
jgi:glycosyltransferase involved in cell wall biosynthesis